MTNADMLLLVVEDNPSDVAWLRDRLRRAPSGESIDVHHAPTLEQAFDRLSQGGVDVVLLDLNLPDATGLETLRKVGTRFPEVPVVVLTGVHNEEAGLAAVNCGAEDFLVKGEVEGGQVARSLRYAAERHRALRELRNLSLVDELTGLHNRRGFITLGTRHLELAARTGRHCTVFYVDLDGMKQINDEHGHAEGDSALRAAAEVLRRSFRASDILGRLGGDEFAALGTNSPPEPPQSVLDRIREEVRRFNAAAARPWALSLSVGTARFVHGVDITIEDLLSQADKGMYQDKTKRRRKTEP